MNKSKENLLNIKYQFMKPNMKKCYGYDDRVKSEKLLVKKMIK